MYPSTFTHVEGSSYSSWKVAESRTEITASPHPKHTTTSSQIHAPKLYHTVRVLWISAHVGWSMGYRWRSIIMKAADRQRLLTYIALLQAHGALVLEAFAIFSVRIQNCKRRSDRLRTIWLWVGLRPIDDELTDDTIHKHQSVAVGNAKPILHQEKNPRPCAVGHFMWREAKTHARVGNSMIECRSSNLNIFRLGLGFATYRFSSSPPVCTMQLLRNRNSYMLFLSSIQSYTHFTILDYSLSWPLICP